MDWVENQASLGLEVPKASQESREERVNTVLLDLPVTRRVSMVTRGHRDFRVSRECRDLSDHLELMASWECQDTGVGKARLVPMDAQEILD